MRPPDRETEVKLAVPSAGEALSLLRRGGFSVTTPRAFESNEVFDFPLLLLRGRSELLRLREFAGKATLTFKGQPLSGPHKSREEIETRVEDSAAFRAILSRLGLEVVFRYEKYRTELARPGEPGHVTLDETPIGTFLELEGEPAWIDATAAALGFPPASYITASYGTLYVDHCRAHGLVPAHMAFDKPDSP